MAVFTCVMSAGVKKFCEVKFLDREKSVETIINIPHQGFKQRGRCPGNSPQLKFPQKLKAMKFNKVQYNNTCMGLL